MKLSETFQVLARAALFDNRSVVPEVVQVWHEVIGHVPLADALDAVAAHYAQTDRRLMPVHVLDWCDERAEERARAERIAEQERVRAETLEILGPQPEPVVTDRSAEIRAALRAMLPPGRPDRLRGPTWLARNPRSMRGFRGQPD